MSSILNKTKNIKSKSRAKVTIRLVVIGSVPYRLNTSLLVSYSSSIFEINDSINTHPIRTNSDGENWEFSDRNIQQSIPDGDGEDITIALTNIPLEDSYYSRRLDDNTVIITLHEVSNYLLRNNIPLENFVYKLLYAYVLIYKRNNKKIPSINDYAQFTHDETKGCIYDMGGIISDIIYSCDRPKICGNCSQGLINNGVSQEEVFYAEKELKKIRQSLFYQGSAWVSDHPVYSIIIASCWSLGVGVLASLLSAYIITNNP